MKISKKLLLAGILLLPFFLNLSHANADEYGEYVEYTPSEGIEVKPFDINFTPSTVFDFQGTPNPNKRSRGDFNVSWVAYYDISKKFED